MKRKSPMAAVALIGAAFMLSGFAGGGAVRSGPATIAYACEGGQQASAIYENGGDFLHAKVLLTYGGRTSELEAAPTLFGIRYVGGEGAQPLAWSVRGERAWLSEGIPADNVVDGGQTLAQCTRLRTTAADAGHAEGEH